MNIRAKLLATASAFVVMGALASAKADDRTNVPGQQGLDSVDKNIAKDKDSDNRGLTNAQQRIDDNMKDRAERKAAKADRDDKTAHVKDKDKGRHDRDKAMRPERAERAEKADRPERPDRPERAGRS